MRAHTHTHTVSHISFLIVFVFLLTFSPHPLALSLERWSLLSLYLFPSHFRLADQIRHLEKTTILQSLLQDFVSLSCFNVPSMQDCHGGKRLVAQIQRMIDLQWATTFSMDLFTRLIVHCNITCNVSVNLITIIHMHNNCICLSVQVFIYFSLLSCCSCTAGFSQATDLIQVLKSMEERGRLNAQSTSKDSKRGTPIRLYKRCLRIIESKKP